MKKILAILILVLLASTVFATPTPKIYGNAGVDRYKANITDVRTGNALTDPLWSGGVGVSVVDLNAADTNVLHSVPIELIPAPGAGKYIDVLDCVIAYNYGTAFTVSDSAEYLELVYGGGSKTVLTGTLLANGFLSATADTEAKLLPVAIGATAATQFDNNDVLLYGTAHDANAAAGTSTLRIVTTYKVQSSGLKE